MLPTSRLLVLLVIISPATAAVEAAIAPPGLITAIRAADRPRRDELLKQPAAVVARDDRDNTALHWAALAGDARLVERLLGAGLDARATNQAGATPLHYGTGSERIVKLLLRAGADPNARSVAGITPLHAAAARPESIAAVRRLLDAGAEVDAIRPVFPTGGVTALALAALAGNERTVKLLLEHGAAPGGTNGYTAVSAAAFAGHGDILKELVAHGGLVNFDDGFAGHALNNVFYADHNGLAPFLIEHGADLHQTSTFGERVPPMVWAAYNETGDPTLTRVLLDRGVEIDEPTSAGDTALRWALKRGETPLTAFLRSHGAHEGSVPLKRKSIPDNAVPADAAGRAPWVRDAVQRAVVLLQRSSDAFLANGFVRTQNCVSCHQQTLPAVAFGRAQERGFRLDEEALARQLQVQRASWSETRDKAYEMYEPQPDSPANLGYGLRGLHALGYQPDELTEAMVRYLKESQLPNGSWPSYDRRPPMEDGQIAGTALAVGALRLYPQPLREPNLQRTFERARRWLGRVEVSTLNQRVFRLLGLSWAGVPPSELRSQVRELLALQRPDGGWAPLPGLESDAWATGHTLFGLREAGGLPVTSSAYQQAVGFLLRTQFPDGSWWVPSRTWPFQPHFDGQFPHGKDQWISAGGTAWAVLALLETLEPVVSRASLPTAQALLAKAAATGPTPSVSPGSAAAAPDQRWEFTRDIQPLLQRSCVECHGSEKARGGLRVDALESLLKGGQSGEPAVVRGQGAKSQLVRLVSDQVEDFEMPPKNRREKYPPLTAAEIQRLREWIDQGTP